MFINWPLVVFSVAVAWLIRKVFPALRRLFRCRMIPSLPEDKLIGGHFDMFDPGTTAVDRTRHYTTARKRGKIARFNGSFHLPSSIFLLHPDVVSPVFNNNIESKASFLPYSLFVPLVGNSIFLVGGAEWKRKRNLVKQAFTRQQIRSFFDTFRILARELTEHLSSRIEAEGTVSDEDAQQGISVIVDDYAAKLTLESFMRCFFCLSSSNWIGQEHQYKFLLAEFDQAFLSRYSNSLAYSDVYFYHISSEGQHFNDTCKKMFDLTATLVEKRRKALRGQQSKEGVDGEAQCLADVLLKMQDLQGESGFSEEDLIYECQLFLIAGYDTSYVALAWTMYLLAAHPGDLRRCQEEIDNVWTGDEDLTWKVMGEVSYVTQCILEALRLYPPAGYEHRILPKDTVLDGYNVPAGTIVTAAAEAIHRDPNFWERPDEFFPEHFSPEQVAKRRPDAFRSFSSGPRKCLGNLFAMDELKVVVIHLLKQFNFFIDPNHIVRDTYDALLRPATGVKLIVCRRSL